MKRLFLLLISFLSLTLMAQVQAQALKSGVFDPPRLAPDFTLQSSQGGELKLSQTRGKLVVLGFGFTHCTEVCPVTLANLAQARKKLGDLADKVQVVYVTVDPQQDTPARLKEYLAVFDPSFIGVTGTEAQLESVQKEYGIVAAKAVGKKGEAQVHHSSYIYLIDPSGYLRALVPFGKKPDDIVHDIKILLQTPDKNETKVVK
ncbi:electron transporter SenC [Cellvibrio zantedeschiae]|uniref:Electron transporter SenC n=1 Tax=Cellvibrio zantedeschiae TaxID=1237077 RepID=A0ABQ3B2T9_9GAMM|nr:SCO family protein [Cellvibrio zantedeschiae]GGY75260.1 electron transporter SenC [Cellvibrio zantedeschiae]